MIEALSNNEEGAKNDNLILSWVFINQNEPIQDSSANQIVSYKNHIILTMLIIYSVIKSVNQDSVYIYIMLYFIQLPQLEQAS